MTAREELYAALMSGGPHSPDRSEKASARIDAYRAEELRDVGWVPCSPKWLVAHPDECGTALRIDGTGDVSHWHPRLTRADVLIEAADALDRQSCGCGCRRGASLLRTLAAGKGASDDAQPTADEPTQPIRDELWRLLDWSLWGAGMGDVLREPLADAMTAAISDEQRADALRIMRWWTEERGRKPVGRWQYEEQERRIKRLTRACARYRAEIAAHPAVTA